MLLALSNLVWIPGMKFLEHCFTQLGNVGPFLASMSLHKHGWGGGGVGLGIAERTRPCPFLSQIRAWRPQNQKGSPGGG